MQIPYLNALPMLPSMPLHSGVWLSLPHPLGGSEDEVDGTAVMLPGAARTGTCCVHTCPLEGLLLPVLARLWRWGPRLIVPLKNTIPAIYIPPACSEACAPRVSG